MSPRFGRRSGFSLTELTAAIAVLGVVGYAIAGSVQLARRAQVTVNGTVEVNGAVRNATEVLRGELRATRDDLVNVTVLPDGNHELRFQVAVADGAGTAFGAFERRLGGLTNQQNLVGGSIVYTVVTTANREERRLERRILDAGGNVRHTRILVRGLTQGGGENPGFAVDTAGDLWRIRITQEARQGGAPRSEEFHVRTRNA